ncbi:MAG: SDR family NAD(P)-dependent oxidoreductase [Spirochaetia bacterium]|nr:SDR family NAD(P)-dependent oxidoreductase [Spirochaetia bacterium]
MKPKMRLSGKSILITGASSGIGEAAAYECVRRGAVPILVARRRTELERVQKHIVGSWYPRRRGSGASPVASRTAPVKRRDTQ